MNWRFGYSLGRTELDGYIYGSASAAADCLKALVPFFFFAAVRNKVWSQAIASMIVWGVVTAYSLTSALGHAALNRMDTSGQRVVEAQSYKDLRSDLERAKGQLAWVPQHRPAAAVQSEIEGLKTKREWNWTNNCTDTNTKSGRDFCQKLYALSSELASAQQAASLESRIADVEAKLSVAGQHAVHGEGDPQAKVLSNLSGLSLEMVQMALVVFVALLLEIGSGLGMYIAFSQWRLYEQQAPMAPAMASLVSAPAIQAAPISAAQAVVQQRRARLNATNDNRQVKPSKLVPPESDVQRFYRERVASEDESVVSASQLYEEYCAWCEQLNKEPLALPTFGRDFSELGVRKSTTGKGVRYIGIALKTGHDDKEDKKLPALGSQAA
jgi:hypothetical protein